MEKKSELERKPITELIILCMGQGLDPIGDKETLIARLLGKEKPEPEPVTKPKAKAKAEAEAEAEAKAEPETPPVTED